MRYPCDGRNIQLTKDSCMLIIFTFKATRAEKQLYQGISLNPSKVQMVIFLIFFFLNYLQICLSLRTQ